MDKIAIFQVPTTNKKRHRPRSSFYNEASPLHSKDASHHITKPFLVFGTKSKNLRDLRVLRGENIGCGFTRKFEFFSYKTAIFEPEIFFLLFLWGRIFALLLIEIIL